MECFLAPKSRSMTLLTGFIEFSEPIRAMLLNVAISFKNSKNIYSVWANETMDYCHEVGTSHANIYGVIQKILNQLDPMFLKECPLIGFFGTQNLTIDSGVLDPYPLWAFPSRYVKFYFDGWFFIL